MGSQEARHVLDGKRLNSHFGEISCDLDVILDIVLTLFGFQYVPCVREVILHKLTGATGGINAEI